VIQVEQDGEALPMTEGKVIPQTEWCVNSGFVRESMVAIL
jgi:hypothetical protein